MTTTGHAPAGTELSTADLLSEIGKRNPTAWETILRQYEMLVWARVRSFRLQHADALDAVQTTWLRLAENSHQVRFPERLGGWLTTTASHECVSILRQAKHATRSAEAVEDAVDPVAGPAQRVVEAETAQILRHLVAELSPRRRTVLWALFVDDRRSYAEVARIIGIPPGSIGPTRARALKQLRDMLEDRGLGHDPAPGD